LFTEIQVGKEIPLITFPLALLNILAASASIKASPALQISIIEAPGWHKDTT